jgi:Putative phage tail protein
MSTAIYLQNALVPNLRQVQERSGSIRELAPDWDMPYVAFLDGKPILRSDWHMVLGDDHVIAFIDADAFPQGGGGGGGGSNPLRVVAMLAVVYFTGGMGGAMLGIEGAAAVGGLGVAIANAAVTMIGIALVNAILPAPKPTSPQQAAALASPSPTYNLQAQGNSGRIDAAIPEHFGRMLCYPDFAAQPYAEYAGNEQYLYMLLCIGRGSYDVETLKIEDTPIDNYEEVAYEYVPPNGAITLFPTDVTTSSEVSGQSPDGTWIGPFIASHSGEFCNFLGIDVMAPRGLYYANDDGSLASMTATFEVQAQAVNALGIAVGSFFSLTSGQSISGATTTPQRASYKYAVSPGRYQVRLRRVDTANTSARYGHDLQWVGLRAYMPDVRVYGDMTLIAVRMRASNNLSSMASRKVNLVCTRKLPIWNGSAWSAVTATRSPSWALAYAAKQIGLSDAQIDLSGLLTLHATCAIRGDSFDARFDNFLSFWEAAGKMLGAVRAKPYMQGGILRCMRDQAVSIPVAMFSQRNIVRGSFSIAYLMPTPDTADSVDVKYFDSTVWAPFTVKAKLPGSTATTSAKIDLFGVIGRDQAYREGMYYAAANRYRRRIIKFQTEMEGFIPSYGDLINVQHDMPAWGQGGEVTAWDSGTLMLTLSEPPAWGVGAHYIGLRKRDGSVDGPFLVTAGASANQVLLSESPTFTPYTGQTEERTHYSFGWAETWRQPARVLAVRPLSLNTVEIECVNEDSNVHTAEIGLITPVIVTSGLANYTTTPTVGSVAARFLFNYPNMAVASWQPAPWADHYYVEISNGDGVWNRVGDTAANSMNFAATYGVTTLVRVAGVGLGRGAWAQSTVTVVPPFDPGAITYAIQLNGIAFTWPQRLEIDAYEIRVDGTNWANSSLVSDVAANGYLWPIQAAGTRTIRLKSRDVNGNFSTNASSVSVVITGPSAPSLNYSLIGPDEFIAWTIPTSGFMVDRYEIRTGSTWATATYVDTTKATSYRRKADFGAAKRYWVAAIDTAGNPGTPASMDVYITEPGVVTAQRTDVIDNNILIYWNAPATGSLPVDRYEVRRGASWAIGDVIGSNGNSTFTTFFEQISGTYSYWIASVDSAGNYGSAVSVTALVNQPPDYVLHADINSTFSGVLTNGIVVNGSMTVPINATETWAQHFANNGYATPQAQINAGYPLYIEPSVGTATYTEAIDYGSVLASTNITATINTVALAGTVAISCQIRWSNVSNAGPWTNGAAGATSCVATTFRFVEVTYSFSQSGGANLLLVEGINIKLSVKQRGDSGSGVAAVGGTSVAFGYAFISADCPMVQPSFTSAAATRFAVVTYVGGVSPTGFSVQIFNSAGTDVGGAFSWSVRGY